MPWNCSQGSSGTASAQTVIAIEHAAAPSSATDRRTRNGSIRQISTSAGTTIRTPITTDDAKVGENRKQEGDGVGIDDQDVEEVDHHPQNRKLELRQHDHGGEQAKRQRGRNRGPAQQREKRKVEQRPGQHEYCRPDPVIFGPQRMTPACGEMDRGDDAHAEPSGAGETFLCRDMAEAVASDMVRAA